METEPNSEHTISDKVQYVLAESKKPQVEPHHCHWPGCGKKVPPAKWGCYHHWMKLPKSLRDKIWATFRPGQEISKTPSAAYITVAQQVREWIITHYPETKGQH